MFLEASFILSDLADALLCPVLLTTFRTFEVTSAVLTLASTSTASPQWITRGSTKPTSFSTCSGMGPLKRRSVAQARRAGKQARARENPMGSRTPAGDRDRQAKSSEIKMRKK